jgi:hypothetical protein
MINQTPNNLDKFPEPVAGSAIPRGWFGRLVRFINSLILHGDGQYLTVKHTRDGQTISPTPALLQELGQRGAPASGGAPTPVAPDFNNPTSVTPETQYGPFNHPVWLIGWISVNMYNPVPHEVYLSLTSPTIIYLFHVSHNSNVTPDIVSLTIPVSLLIPPSTPFTVHTITTRPQDLTVILNYYPLI